MENLMIELKKFSPAKFNEQYRNLIEVGQTAGELEYEMLDALHFIKECETMFARVLEKLPVENQEKQSVEAHCPLCEAKEKTIQILRESLQSKDRTIHTIEQLKDKYKKELTQLKAKT